MYSIKMWGYTEFNCLGYQLLRIATSVENFIMRYRINDQNVAAIFEYAVKSIAILNTFKIKDYKISLLYKYN